jgi:hypothetical protein
MMIRNMTMACLPVLATVLAAAPALAAEAPAASGTAPVFEQPATGTTDFTGKWAMVKSVPHLLTTDGKEPPLNEAGKAEYAKRKAALKAGDHKIDPVSTCLMHGIPRLLYAPYPFLILQTTRNLTFVHEANHTFRIIYWDKAPPAAADVDPTYLGSAAARIEGKTLIIDSVSFNDLTWLDYTGLPHGEKLTVQERYTLSDPRTLSGEVRITDPQYYSTAWNTHFTLKRQPGMSLKENVCMDTHQM